MEGLEALAYRPMRAEEIRTIECTVYGCRGTVVLKSHWVNVCDACGGEYNAEGMRLAPRSQ